MQNKNCAAPFLRILAKVIDFLIGLAVFLVLLLPVFSKSSLEEILDSLLLAITGFIYLSVIIPVFYAYLTANYGGSPGKILLGLKITDEKGKLLSLKRALFRTYIGYSVSTVFFGMGYYWIFVDEKRRGWHDLAAGSVVLNANPQRIGLGILAICGLLILNLFFVKQIAERSFQNRLLYQEIMSGFISENEKPEDIMPTPTPAKFELMPLISKEEAENIIRSLPEVQEYFAQIPTTILDMEGYDAEKNQWNVHIYNIVEDHTATFDWYYVDGNSGKVTKLTEMPLYKW